METTNLRELPNGAMQDTRTGRIVKASPKTMWTSEKAREMALRRHNSTPEQRLAGEIANKLRKMIASEYLNASKKPLNKLVKGSGKACAICGCPEALSSKGLYLDHDHKTTKVRGLVCPTCNSQLVYIDAYWDKIVAHLSRGKEVRLVVE
jgi:hypothetical protein